jgi:hypothetical protein
MNEHIFSTHWTKKELAQTKQQREVILNGVGKT